MLVCLSSPQQARSADYGRISGVVFDPQGTPLMGATVQIIGPMLMGLPSGGKVVEKIITDAHGRFAVERLLPGLYSLQVTSATRFPILRSGIRVEPGRSVEQSFVLADILAPIRLSVPSGNVTSWGDDWKWVLRTSASTRPILRFQPKPAAKSKTKGAKSPLPSGERLIAMNPGSSRSHALSGDPGMGSVIAFTRVLSENTDLLVAGSMGASGMTSNSVATVLRRDAFKGDPQELSLAIHQLNFSEGIALGARNTPDGRTSAQALSANYSQSRRVLSQLILTAGFDFDYLYAGQDAMSARPYMKAEYELSPASSIVVRHGAARVDSGQSLLDRVGALTSFPRITMQGYQPHLERLTHSEAGYARKIGKKTRIEAAAYHDQFQNAALWGFGDNESLSGLAGNVLANPAANGVTLNAGQYSSSGFRAAFVRKLGDATEVSMLYAMGDALTAVEKAEPQQGPVKDLRSALRTRQTQTVGGRISTRIPRAHTYITTSYLWIPAGRLNSVDPVGQANLQIQPYLGVQIRQPLPSLAFLPAKFEAMADFQNLLSQGYVPVGGTGDESLLVTPAYRSIRGGFSVQF
jgi:hypothetical protein